MIITKDHHTQALPVPTIKAYQRQLKVREAYHSYQLNQQHPIPVGEIHLKGQWLIQTGFDIHAPITVSIKKDCLVVTTDN